MAINAEFFKDLVARHNDQNDTTRIYNIQGSSQTNYMPDRFYNPDNLKYPSIEIVDGDVVIKEEVEAAHGNVDNAVMTTRLGISNIDHVRYFDEGDELDFNTGKKVVSKKILITLLSSIEDMDLTSKTEASISNLEEQMTKADNVIKDAYATQQQIDNMVIDLQTAMDNLEEIPEEPEPEG